ncbi:MAG: hypothetical protein AAFU53_19905 [Cyanobacteria bacterium J06632_3]
MDAVEAGAGELATHAYVALLANLPEAHKVAYDSMICDPGSRGGTTDFECDAYQRAMAAFQHIVA